MASPMNTDRSTQPNTNLREPAYSTSRHVEADGLQLHYLDYGTAGRPPMLCVHGGGAHAHWFDFVAPSLCNDYHVRALDQRGHGDSAWTSDADYSYGRYAADLAEVVENLDLRDFVLVGHSMGGMISLLYAATRPERLGKLIVIDSTVHMSEDRVAGLRDIGARPGRSYATREEFIARFRLRPTATTAAPKIIRHLAQHSSRLDGDGSWRHKFDRNVFARRESVDGLPAWGRINVPALLIKGSRSQRITPQIQAAITANCPQAEMAEVADSDHHVTLDNPVGFVRAVKAFLGR